MTISIQLIAGIFCNLLLSGIAGALAKQWAATNVPLWLILGVAANSIGFCALAWVIRSAGLGLGTSIALICTIVMNMSIGIFFFGETISYLQTAGIALALVAIGLMLFG